VGESDVGHLEVRDRVLAHVQHRDAQHHRDRQAGVDDHPSLREGVLAGEVGVEVVLVRVHRQQRQPCVVGHGDRPSQRVLVDVTDDEALEESTESRRVSGHETS
jgi:hypothetical protein